MSNVRGPGQVEISIRYLRHVGPMNIQGSLTLQFDSLRPYSFIARVQWPGGSNYESAVREAVEEVLQERQGSLDSTRVVLTHIEWDDVASCEVGFRKAAAAATRAAFEV